jgi:hypothetical protein
MSKMKCWKKTQNMSYDGPEIFEHETKNLVVTLTKRKDVRGNYYSYEAYGAGPGFGGGYAHYTFEIETDMRNIKKARSLAQKYMKNHDRC